MSLAPRVRLLIPPIALFSSSRRRRVMETGLSRAMRAALMLQDAALVQHTPVGVSGRARTGWQQRVEIVSTRPVAIIGESFNLVPYIVPLDQGQTRHWPPWGPGTPLALWAQRKLGNSRLAFVVARSIARGTTRGTALTGAQISSRARRETHGRIRRLFQEAYRRIREGLER